MGEALLIKAGSSGDSSRRTGLITEIFTSNTLWRVPEGIRNNQVSVRIFGGGGGGFKTGTASSSASMGGGGGYMNNGIINLYENDNIIQITIGRGGIFNSAGGITSFGTYIYASGGGTGSGGSGGGSSKSITACTGYQFGGGGSPNVAALGGGNGGKWGGGGGGYNAKISLGGCLYENGYSFGGETGYSGLAGNGGNKNINTENGTNTIGLGIDFEGAGLARTHGNKYTGGGGGYGGNGGNGSSLAGGGGGYGGNGGDASGYSSGGGGGYGGRGGNGYNYDMPGGGGGYGKYGQGAEFDSTNNRFVIAGIAAGGSGQISGGDGICIIQYYID